MVSKLWSKNAWETWEITTEEKERGGKIHDEIHVYSPTDINIVFIQMKLLVIITSDNLWDRNGMFVYRNE